MRCLTLAEALSPYTKKLTFVCRDFEGNMTSLIESCGYDIKRLSAIHFDAKDVDANDASSAQTLKAEQGEHQTYLNIDENDDSTWLGVDYKIDAMQTIEAVLGTDLGAVSQLASGPSVSDLAATGDSSKLIDLLIVDHYGLDARWQDILIPYSSKIMVIDDLANRQHNCDLLLDQTYLRKQADYTFLVPSHCKLICGAQFALLRNEFSQILPHERQNDGNGTFRIFVFLGGSDPQNISANVLRAIDSIAKELAGGDNREIVVDLVLGAQNKHRQQLSTLLATLSFQCNLHINVSNMAMLMRTANLAIGAAGTSSWERCSLGLPSLVYVYAENQLLISEQLLQANAIKIWRDEKQLSEQIRELFINKALRANMSAAAKQICDGHGTQRTLDAVKALFSLR